MTYLKVLCFVLSLLTFKLWAEDSTPHSFNKFCSDAKADLENLNKLSEKKLVKINELSSSIEKIDAQIKLYEGINAAVANYKNAFDASASEQFSKQGDFNKLKIVQFQNLLAASVNLKAIELLTKPETNPDTNTRRSKVSTLEELCSLESNSNEPICKSDAKELGRELDSLNKNIANFNSLQLKADDPKIAKHAQDLYDAIPKSINPDASIALLLGSPKLKSILNEDTTSSMSACLDKTNTNQQVECNKLMTSNQGLSDELKGVFQKLSEKNKHAWESNNLNSKVIETSNKIIGQFDNQQIDGDLIKKSLEELKSKCKQVPESNEALERCVQLNNTLDREAYQKSESLKADKKQKTDLLNEVTKGAPTFDFLEKMKSYVSIKFKRTCSSAPDELPLSNLCNSSNPSNGAITLNTLTDQVKSILSRVSTATPRASDASRGEFGVFSKKELAEFITCCNNNSTSSCNTENTKQANPNTCERICSEATSEYNKIKSFKDADEWDEYQRKYWVDKTPNPENGKDYTAVEKKSNWRILGEGLVQSRALNQGIGIWIADMQLQSQIDMMTQQALFQKQLMYMNNPNSPWMINYPYFPSMGPSIPNAAGGFNFGQ